MTNTSSKTDLPASVVLVDAYSTGAVLARSFAREHVCVHVRSRAAMPAAFSASLPQGVFAADLAFQGDIDALAAAVAAHRPRAVVAASEFGVELADLLATRLGLPGNTPDLSRARRDKYLMANAVAKAGVPVAAQMQGSELAGLLQWYREQPERRVVAKPLDSAGSDDVYFCDDERQVAAAAQRILGKTNLMMQENRAILLQHQLDGDEYVVNSVSHAGLHWVTDIWRCHKLPAGTDRKIYDREDLVPPAAAEVAPLIAYASAVLDALGIGLGPAHTELILTAQGPRLLETGARISGLANPAALALATGTDQVELTTECHVDPDRLSQRPRLYERHKHARCVNLIARRAATLSHPALQRFFGDLASFESVRFRLADGAQTRPTTDLNTSPGALFLVHSDPGQIEHDYHALRQWEERFL
ncbi:MAG: ATP-grasp domain-containing protein [Ramlibacter sp.]|nr:ATP-grasp domain-containing protein [Ramlibacter sp.]